MTPTTPLTPPTRLERALGFVGISLKYDPRPADRMTNITLLLACGLLVLLPFLFTYNPAGNHVRIASFTLPAMCASRAVFNTDCPGCGLTRSFISLAHGKLDTALRLHRLAPALYLFFAMQVGYRLWCLIGTRGVGLERAGRINHIVGWVLIAALLTNWAVGMVLGAGN